MDNSTEAPEDEYDVLIDGDLQSSEPPPCDMDAAKVLSPHLLQPLFFTVFTLGLLDNILLVLILVKQKGLKHTENLYLLNLAIANVCLLLSLPFWALGAWSEDHTRCQTFTGLYWIGVHGEACFSSLLMVHSCSLALSPRQGGPSATRKVRRGVVTTMLAWILAVAMTLPESIFYKPPVEGQKLSCSFRRPHFLAVEETLWKRFLTLKMNILVFFLPLCVFVFCCSVRIRKPLRSGAGGDGLCWLVLATMLAFLLMWAPFHVALFLSTFQECFPLQDCQSSHHLHASVQITKVIATSHGCVPPLLCVILHKPIRKYLSHLFHPSWCTPRRAGEDAGQAPLRSLTTYL